MVNSKLVDEDVEGNIKSAVGLARVPKLDSIGHPIDFFGVNITPPAVVFFLIIKSTIVTGEGGARPSELPVGPADIFAIDIYSRARGIAFSCIMQEEGVRAIGVIEAETDLHVRLLDSRLPV